LVFLSAAIIKQGLSFCKRANIPMEMCPLNLNIVHIAVNNLGQCKYFRNFAK
jgi:hypothetical protein